MEQQKYHIGVNWVPEWGMAVCNDEQDVAALKDLIENHLVTGRALATFRRWPGEV